MREQTSSESAVSIDSQGFDLVPYAREHRHRLRNLHDGGPVPPAIWRPPKGHRPVYTGAEDRWDAIVGRSGYVAMDGERLTVTLEYKTGRGVKRALIRLEAMGAQAVPHAGR